MEEFTLRGDILLVELFTFGKGVITQRSPLLLEDGELVSSSGFSYETDGVLETRKPKRKVNSTAVTSIHTIRRYMNHIILGDTNNVRHKWDLDGFCNLYIPPTGENFDLLGTLISTDRWKVAEHREFSLITNEHDKKAIANGLLYDWGVDNPTEAPIGTAGAAGNPNDTYSLYYTFVVKFPNGRVYETGPSPAGSVTVSSEQILWSNIKTCPYSGSGLVIHRKLYRYSTTLAEKYLVATISDNTTTTYTDNVTDATLLLGTILSTTTYQPPPDNIVDAVDYLNRVFVIAKNYLYWSEVGIPFAFPAANSILISREGEDLVALVSWGDQLYIAEEKAWHRLQGSDATTWAIRGTFAGEGVINKHTLKATKYGIVGLWYDGIYIFDGTVSKNITKDILKDSFFSDMGTKSACFAEFDGRRYYFVYPTSGTTLDKCLIIDFIDYPALKLYHRDFVPTAYQYHKPTGIEYMGKSDGYQYEDGTSETISVSLKTGDRVMKDITHQKETDYLYYDIDTNGKDVVLTFYADGTAQTPAIILNESTRKRARKQLPKWQGYRFALGLSCADAQNLKIYDPWEVGFTPYGD